MAITSQLEFLSSHNVVFTITKRFGRKLWANHGNDVIVVQRFSRSRILEKLQRKVTSKTVNVIIKKRRLTAIFHNLYFCMRLTESGKSSSIPSSHEFSSVLRVREQLCFTAVETRAKKVVCSRSLKWAQQITKTNYS